MNKRNFHKENNGFTLVEMVISVAFLAVISIFLLQLFISANNLRIKAYDLDKSVTISKQVIENLKACKKPKDIEACELMKKGVIEETENTINITFYFDDNWKVLEKSNTAQEKAAFTINTVIKAQGEAVKGIANVYNIDVKVIKTKPYALEEKKDNEVYTINAVKYFAGL